MNTECMLITQSFNALVLSWMHVCTWCSDTEYTTSLDISCSSCRMKLERPKTHALSRELHAAGFMLTAAPTETAGRASSNLKQYTGFIKAKGTNHAMSPSWVMSLAVNSVKSFSALSSVGCRWHGDTWLTQTSKSLAAIKPPSNTRPAFTHARDTAASLPQAMKCPLFAICLALAASVIH